MPKAPPLTRNRILFATDQPTRDGPKVPPRGPSPLWDPTLVQEGRIQLVYPLGVACSNHPSGWFVGRRQTVPPEGGRIAERPQPPMYDLRSSNNVARMPFRALVQSVGSYRPIMRAIAVRAFQSAAVVLMRLIRIAAPTGRARCPFLALPYLPVSVDAEQTPIPRGGSHSRTPLRDERGATRICPKMMSLNRMADATRPPAEPRGRNAERSSAAHPPAHTPKVTEVWRIEILLDGTATHNHLIGCFDGRAKRPRTEAGGRGAEAGAARCRLIWCRQNRQ